MTVCNGFIKVLNQHEGTYAAMQKVLNHSERKKFGLELLVYFKDLL
jgi:hypothetical protein